MGKVKHYSEETKRYAINKVLVEHANIHDVCQELGCGYTSIKKWITEYRELGEAFFAPKGTFFVYIHISPEKPHKVYIGITKQNPLIRWHYGSSYKNNRYFSQAIKKYGWDNFEHKILYYGLTHEEANQKEIELIEKYHSKDRRYGYNQTDGGDGSHGVIVSEETRKKVSQFHKGRKRPEITGKRISITNGHPVKQYSLDGKYIQTFHSTGEAARQLGKPSDHQAHIVACCNGKRHRAYGYRWSWAEEYQPPISLEVISPLRKKVAQYYLDGRYIKTFDTLTEAGLSVRSDDRKAGTNIGYCCAGKIKYAYGYLWRYADTDDESDIEGLRRHPRYGDVKKFLSEGHSKKEASSKFDIPLMTLYRYLNNAKETNLSEDDCLQ